MIRKITIVLFSLCTVFANLEFFAVSAEDDPGYFQTADDVTETDSGEAEMPSLHNRTNINLQNYTAYSGCVSSHIVPLEDGYMLFSAYENNLRAVYINGSDTIYDIREISEGLLPLYGGFLAADDGYYYIVSGQENPEESADVECFRITKYDRDWNCIGFTGLKDCNTTIPFAGGSCRMAYDNGYLLIHTCHEMYKADDGYNHQANVTHLRELLEVCLVCKKRIVFLTNCFSSGVKSAIELRISRSSKVICFIWPLSTVPYKR